MPLSDMTLTCVGSIHICKMWRAASIVSGRTTFAKGKASMSVNGEAVTITDIV